MIDIKEELITKAVNDLAEKMSKVLLDEFSNLPKDLQMSFILIKSTQLLLANILCHVGSTKQELERITDAQGEEIKELTVNCAFTGFANKFLLRKH